VSNNDSSKELLKIADRDQLPPDHPMRLVAKELDEAFSKYDEQPSRDNLKACMELWKKGGNVWRDYHGGKA
jgi:hypothetical protein